MRINKCAARVSLTVLCFYSCFGRSTELYDWSKTTTLKDPVASSWHKCLDRAEENRSLRDLEFFLSAAHLNNPKTWLPRHSLNNEMQFCSEVKNCEEKHGQQYEEKGVQYPACQQD